jgi:hypothetical protein
VQSGIVRLRGYAGRSVSTTIHNFTHSSRWDRRSPGPPEHQEQTGPINVTAGAVLSVLCNLGQCDLVGGSTLTDDTDVHSSSSHNLLALGNIMPICQGCRTAYLESESHKCVPKSSPGLVATGVVFGAIAGALVGGLALTVIVCLGLGGSAQCGLVGLLVGVPVGGVIGAVACARGIQRHDGQQDDSPGSEEEI